MDFWGTIHEQAATAVTIFSGLMTLYALFLVISRRPLDGNFWGAIAVGEILIIAHSLTGVGAWIFGNLPARGVHFLYGATTIIAWPAVYVYTQGETNRPLLWVFANAFVFGVALRSSQTGRMAFDFAAQLIGG